MTEGIIITLLTAGTTLIGFVLRAVLSNKGQATDAIVAQVRERAVEDARHVALDGKIERILEGSAAHAVQATEIEDKLDTHIQAVDRALERNHDDHEAMTTKIGRIEGWIEGRQRAD